MISISKNSGLKPLSGLKQNVLNPRSLRLVNGNTSISGPSGSPTIVHQSRGIVSSYGPTFNATAGPVKLSRKIKGIKK